MEKIESECLKNLKKTIVENKQKFELFKNHLNSSVDGTLNLDKIIKLNTDNKKIEKNTLKNQESNKKAISNVVYKSKKAVRPGSAVTVKKPTRIIV